MVKTSKIWQYSREELVQIIKKSNSVLEVLKFLGLRAVGGNYKTLYRRAEIENIDLKALKKREKTIRGKQVRFLQIPTNINDLLIENSNTNRNNLKKRLIKEKLINNFCDICKIKPEWCSKLLILQLDHINGVHNDNRLENLRLLCPNCHSQTDNFAGRATRKKYICENCKNEVWKGSKLCSICSGINKRKVERPALNDLLNEIAKTSYRAVGRKYGVSDNTIRKWIK